MTTPSKSCFFITPIGVEGSLQRRQADWVFEYLAPALDEKGYSLTRADKVIKPNQITVDIFERAINADLCIADLSFLNANVMYELGVRHMSQWQAILIANSEWMERLPFDTQNQRTIGFDIDSPQALKRLAANVSAMIDEIEQEETVSNPLTHALGSISLQTSGDSRDKIIADIANRLEYLEQAPAHSEIAAGIHGQGELATKNVVDLRQLWLVDQKAREISWSVLDGGVVTGSYKGFTITISPQSNGRWSGSASVPETGVDIPYPRWQPTLDDAKSTVIKAIDARLEEISSSAVS